eukprot:4191277-Ditylum_brightwellii.AAC.1
MHSALNGNMGRLGLVMPPADYTARNGGIAYVALPNNPGPYDGTIANNAGSAVRNVIINILGEALPRWLLAEIEDRDTGLNNVSILDIFDHTFDRRSQIDDDLVDEYTSKFNTALDVAQGFNVYLERQEECRDFFSDAQQPITNQQLAAKRQMHIGQT